jgi:hypothetical protein
MIITLLDFESEVRKSYIIWGSVEKSLAFVQNH